MSSAPPRQPRGEGTAHQHGSGHDIGDERIVLQQSEERFRLLVESIEDYAIFMLDSDGRVASWNAGAERLKQYRADEIIGRHFRCFYPDDDRKAGWPEYELRVAASEGRFEDEGWRMRKDGSRFWANVVITALRDSRGALVGFAKVTRDLTESKRVEALEESERRMTEFLGVLSHELRNPLAPIRSMLDLFKRKDITDPQLKLIRDVIDNQVNHMTRVVSDLLDVTRIKRGLISVRQGSVAVADVVSHSLEAVRPLLTSKGHRLHVSNEAESLCVDGDLVRLTQVVVNLLNNAASYTPPAGDIWLRVYREGEEAVVSVRDTGRGIEPSELKTIFDFFPHSERPSESGHGHGQGLGIGLSLAKRLVELHGGRIDARSDGPGRGSEFLVRLPLSAPATAAATAPEAPPAEEGVRRVLIVDDNRDFAESMALLLESMGHRTATAHDGLRALEAAREFHPDVVILDIGLPKLDGHEVARRLRAEPGQRYVLAALTGWGQESDRRLAMEAGFDYHLVKPVELDALEQVLSSRPKSAEK